MFCLGWLCRKDCIGCWIGPIEFKGNGFDRRKFGMINNYLRLVQEDPGNRQSVPAVKSRKHVFADIFQGDAALAIRVNDLYEWMDFLALMDEYAEEESSIGGHHRYPRKWVFRGQANAEWNIKSSFEVSLPGDLKDESNVELLLREKERRTFMEFRRFGYAHLHGLPEMNFPEWLTYMQHFGVKTRMVDFTESPLTALYFSQEDKQQMGDFAVWGVCISALSPFRDMPEFKKLKGTADGGKYALVDDFIESLFKVQGCTTSNVASQWGCATRIFDYKEEFNEEQRIFYFYPRWHNSRSSAQSGLFLMASHLSVPFHEILMARCSNQMTEKFELADVRNADGGVRDIVAHLRVVKFEFPASLRGKANRLLKIMDKNPRTIYPDIQGLAKSLECPLNVR